MPTRTAYLPRSERSVERLVPSLSSDTMMESGRLPEKQVKKLIESETQPSLLPGAERGTKKTVSTAKNINPKETQKNPIEYGEIPSPNPLQFVDVVSTWSH